MTNHNKKIHALITIDFLIMDGYSDSEIIKVINGAGLKEVFKNISNDIIVARDARRLFERNGYNFGG